jgi:hypothetical protein
MSDTSTDLAASGQRRSGSRRLSGKTRESWKQRAKRLGVSTRTLDRWVERGILDQPEYICGRKYGSATAIPRLDKARKI